MAVYPSRKIVLPQRVNLVNFLQSHGTEYINTGIFPNQNTTFELDCQFTETKAAMYPFGSEAASTSLLFFVGYASSLGWYYAYNNSYQGTTAVGATDRVTIRSNKISCSFNGSTVNVSASTFGVSYPIWLFALNDVGRFQADWTAACKIHSCKIWDNGTLAGDFRPCLDPAGVPCMYDMVSEQYFYNAGSGTFAYG